MCKLNAAIIYIGIYTDRCINSPGYDRSKIDGINGSYKTYLKQKI